MRRRSTLRLAFARARQAGSAGGHPAARRPTRCSAARSARASPPTSARTKGYTYSPGSGVAFNPDDALWVFQADVTSGVPGRRCHEVFGEIAGCRASRRRGPRRRGCAPISPGCSRSELDRARAGQHARRSAIAGPARELARQLCPGSAGGRARREFGLGATRAAARQADAGGGGRPRDGGAAAKAPARTAKAPSKRVTVP